MLTKRLFILCVLNITTLALASEQNVIEHDDRDQKIEFSEIVPNDRLPERRIGTLTAPVVNPARAERRVNSLCPMVRKILCTLGLAGGAGCALFFTLKHFLPAGPDKSCNYPRPIDLSYNVTEYCSGSPIAPNQTLANQCFYASSSSAAVDNTQQLHCNPDSQYCPTPKSAAQVVQEQFNAYKASLSNGATDISTCLLAAPATDPACANNPCTPYVSPTTQSVKPLTLALLRQQELKDKTAQQVANIAQRAEQQNANKKNHRQTIAKMSRTKQEHKGR